MSESRTPPPTSAAGVRWTEQQTVQAVRIRLVDERPAPQPDPLGRARVGYTATLAPAELWDRARGVWKAKLATLADCTLAVIVYNDAVVGVGTVEAIAPHEDRVAIDGRILVDHPLVGQRDPLHNTSRNPITYGHITTVLPTSTPARPYEAILKDAITLLTEVGRLRRTAMRPAEVGTAADGSPRVLRWEVDPDRADPSDWAEFVTLALAGAAANLGGIEAALAGRSGSWEAAGVRSLLESTVGDDQERLWEHRTEPMLVVLDVDVDWLEELYEASYSHIWAMAEEAARPFEDDSHVWRYAKPYRVDEQRIIHDLDRAAPFTCDDPDAPALGEAMLDRARGDLRALGVSESHLDSLMDERTALEIRVSKSDADRDAIVELYRLSLEAQAPFEDQMSALRVHEERERAEYRERVRAVVRAEAAHRYPGVTIEFLDPAPALRINDWGDFHEEGSPEAELIEHAKRNTPLPGSDLPLADYPAEYDLPTPEEVLAVESSAGRLPHQRLLRTTDGQEPNA